MARVVFDSFEPNNACFESPAAKPSGKKTNDECEVSVIFHAEGSPGYDPNQAPTVYFRRKENLFVLEISPGFSTSVGLLRGLGFQDNDPSLQSKIYYSIGLSDALKTLYERFIKSKEHPVLPFMGLVTQYRNFLITGSIDSSDPISFGNTSSLLESILNASEDALDFINTLNASFKDPQANQSRILPETLPRVEWLSSLIQAHTELKASIQNIQKVSDNLQQRSTEWMKQVIRFIWRGKGDTQMLFEEFGKLADIYREQGNIPPEFKNFAALVKNKLAIFNEAGKLSQSNNLQTRWFQIMNALTKEDLRFQIYQAAQSGSLQLEVSKELREAKVSTTWLEDKERLQELTEALFAASKPFNSSSRQTLFTLDISLLEKSFRKMVGQHGIQEREYYIGCLALLRYLKNQNYLGGVKEEEKENENLKFKLSPEAFQALGFYEQKLAKKVSSSLKKTNIALPLAEAGICIVGGILAGTGGGIQNRPLTLSGSTITGLGCGALSVHFIPNRNPYITDSLGGALGAALAFTAAWFANTASSSNNLLMGREDKNPVSGFGP